MFEIVMLAGFLIAGISQLIPDQKNYSGNGTGVSKRKSSGKREPEANQHTRRRWVDNYIRPCRQVEAA